MVSLLLIWTAASVLGPWTKPVLGCSSSSGSQNREQRTVDAIIEPYLRPELPLDLFCDIMGSLYCSSQHKFSVDFIQKTPNYWCQHCDPPTLNHFHFSKTHVLSLQNIIKLSLKCTECSHHDPGPPWSKKYDHGSHCHDCRTKSSPEHLGITLKLKNIPDFQLLKSAIPLALTCRHLSF
jgi:hypothetical protein